MKKIVQVPDLGDANEVEVIEVCVKKGDVISAEDPLIVLESEKAAMEVPSPDAGKIVDIKISLGDQVSKGDSILEIEFEEINAGKKLFENRTCSPPVQEKIETENNVSSSPSYKVIGDLKSLSWFRISV